MGRSEPGLFGRYNHYDNRGKKTGHSDSGLFGSYTHREIPMEKRLVPAIRVSLDYITTTVRKMVQRLNDNGVEYTPYNDRQWR